MLRAVLYLGISGVIWFAEGFLFSRFLGFSTWQTAVLGAFYLVLFVGALLLLRRAARADPAAGGELANWRALSLAPMITTILGSFLSLPVVLLVLGLGKLP